MASVYNIAKGRTMDGQIDLDTGDIRVLLVKSGYTFNADHDYVADLTPASNEISGTGYVRKALASKTVTVDDTNNRAAFDAADLVWTGLDTATVGIAAAVVYQLVTNDADSPLIAYIDLTPAIAGNGGDFTVAWNAGGILRVT